MREILRRERLKSGMTQQEIADKIGISRVHYTQIENASHNKNPSFQVSIRIKNVLNYHKDDLFLIENVPDKNKC